MTSLLLDSKQKHFHVLDKGYARYKDHMGSDLAIVNAAKVSYEKEADEWTTKEARLLGFLAREGHLSPFRHAVVKFEFKAPLMVARQHWKYVVGSDHTMDGWNEASRRYVTDREEFYLPKPDEWRSAPENSKQGSGEPLPLDIGSELFQLLMEDYDRQLAHYKYAMSLGACAEQARLYLMAYGLYVRYIWTASMQSILHFLAQRLEHDAQKEIQLYATAVRQIVQPLFPATMQLFGL